ncbi:hypothetical protein SAMN02745165_01747 [Malonomonas rubra DSM 5091]|uniref:DUF6915 domain-containing protein n=1 Tax=Malonomonas rubra DSM 5091 TaxID=1122189 RepID=A0A1M6H9K3_MALRU|nr:hypothetical protein [Malonomonas rubra]SHJ18912.1 hypothetical protein SAMN02745165_01747 [Malonomonas rubra DSM 5091]
MNQQQYEKACFEKFGESWPEVHRFLDQYFDLTRSMSHRVILHHRQGIELVVAVFGEAARGPAEQHIELDFGFVAESPGDLEKYYYPTTDEEDQMIQDKIKEMSPVFNRQVLVRSTSKSQVEQLYQLADHVGEIVQHDEHWGFSALFEIPRPTKANCQKMNVFIGHAIGLGVEHCHCSVLAIWTSLEEFVSTGKKEP